jgi:membrane fusion protein, multidrug efflux system
MTAEKNQGGQPDTGIQKSGEHPIAAGEPKPGNEGAAATKPPPRPANPWLKRALQGGLGIVTLAAAFYFGIPWVLLVMNTVSTDDAYVNGHVTLVAARVPGQVVEVKVDDNYRVKTGDLVVLLDKVPYQVQVDLKKAALATAKANLDVTLAQVYAQAAQARASRFKLEHAMEDVNNQVAQLRANVATVDSNLAKRERALKDFERTKALMKTTGATTQQEFDLRLQDYLVAKAQVRQALEGVYQIRASLGLVNKPVNVEEITEAPKSLAAAPADLDQTFSTVRQALGEMLQSVAPLGVHPSSFDLSPKKVLEEFLKRDPDGNIDHIYHKIIANAPTIAQAKAKVEETQRDLDQALLNLSYCEVRAEIDGVVTRRNVNPGNNVQAGQSVMAVRSLREIWIDANFKETQLANLRIGQPATIEVDMYGSHHEFKGRITGFTMGTGQTLALLPPQNATGNFVKIVQRLPVKIELIDYDPDRIPLFVGLSVTPYVYFRKPPIGDDPGKGDFLQPFAPLPRGPIDPKL